MPLYTRKTSILAKLETTYGVDAIPTGAVDAMVIRNASLTPLDIESVDRDLMRSYLGSSPQLVVGMKALLDFEIEIAGAGTSAITKPKYDCLMQACGFASVVNTTVSNDYTPVSENFKSVTLYTYIDGTQHAITGARGSVSLEFNAKAIPVMKFKFVGKYVPPSNVANPNLTTTAWQTPLGVNNTNTSGFALHGFAGALQSLTIDMGNVVNHRILVGRETIEIVDRKPSGSITIDAPDTLASKNFFQAAIDMVLGNLTLTHGTAAFNKFKVDCGNVQVLRPTYGDQDGVRTLQMGLQFVPSTAGNDEVKFSTL